MAELPKPSGKAWADQVEDDEAQEAQGKGKEPATGLESGLAKLGPTAGTVDAKDEEGSLLCFFYLCFYAILFSFIILKLKKMTCALVRVFFM